MTTKQRKRVTVRVDAGAYEVIRDTADRLGVPIGTYMVARAVADAEKATAAITIAARIDALETTLTGALVDRDERLSEALDGLAERMTTAARTDTNALAERITASVQAAVGAPGSGVTVATLQRLSRSIESVIQHELGRLARGEYRAVPPAR